MKKFIIQIQKCGFAELNFEYFVDVPDKQLGKFVSELNENDIDTIKRYPNFIIKDYRSYIEKMSTKTFTINPKMTLNDDISSFNPKRLVPYIRWDYYHGEEISVLLNRAFEKYKKNEFKAMLNNIEKEISKLESTREQSKGGC